MSASRAFSTSAKKALVWVGATELDLIAANGSRGPKVVEAVHAIEAHAEAMYPGKASVLKIQGTKLHKSTKDPNETEEVVSVSVLTESGTRLLSGHAQASGGFTTHTARAGR
ncbi:hypothetical protein K461DRAFT_296079 [Myriangium duriaei CBS 260.36]|uniref:Uncharacterized protein n=1 Tax=Myriangium duriaei CBS 260.36 TaxID=1168546 RepID=A0A9P4IY94_9PEZI|nr:hypothetical protein K461DRAFT_296079 [Myriangium duriaei CBS 260.36]